MTASCSRSRARPAPAAWAPVVAALVPFFLLAILAPGPAGAQSRPAVVPQARCSDDSGGGKEGEGGTKYEVVTGPDGRRIFRIKTGFVICGKVPKPDVLYGLLNTTINYEWETLKQDFLPKVLRAPEQSPF